MNLDWMKTWRKQRILGMLPHIKSELKEHPELAVNVIENVKRDSEAMALLKKNGITIS